jgi:hypothetical protein
MDKQVDFLYRRFEVAFLTHANATKTFYQADILSYADATTRWGRTNSRFGGSNANMRDEAVKKYRARLVEVWGRLLNADNLLALQQI